MRALYTLVLLLLAALVPLVGAAPKKAAKKAPRAGRSTSLASSSSSADPLEGHAPPAGSLDVPDVSDMGDDLEDTPRPSRGRPTTRRVVQSEAPSTDPSSGPGGPLLSSPADIAPVAGTFGHPQLPPQNNSGSWLNENPVEVTPPPPPPRPETPEHIGRRYLALQTDPPNRDLYSRPDIALPIPNYPPTDRHLERRLHPHFIFNDAARTIRYRELIHTLKSTIHRLEVETDADALLLCNRPEDPAGQASFTMTRGIEADSTLSSVSGTLKTSFQRFIAGPRHNQYVELRQLGMDEVAAHEAQLLQRVEAAAAARRALEDMERLSEAPEAPERGRRSPPLTRSRAASRTASLARSHGSRSRSASPARPPGPRTVVQPAAEPPRTPIRPQREVIDLSHLPDTPPPMPLRAKIKSPPPQDLCTPSPPRRITQPVVQSAKGKARADTPPGEAAGAARQPADGRHELGPVRDASAAPSDAQLSGSVVPSSDIEEADAEEYAAELEAEELARACAESLETARTEQLARQAQADEQQVASTSSGSRSTAVEAGPSRPRSVVSHRSRRLSVHLPSHITAALVQLEIPETHWAAFEQTWRAHEDSEYPARIVLLSERFALDLAEDEVDWLAAVFLRNE